jgi:hypothetical protein
LLLQFSGPQSNKYDEVRIYFSSADRLVGIGPSCSNNEDYLRVHATIKISLLDRNEVEEVKELLLDEKLYEVKRPTHDYPVVMVIDFISNGRIIKTLAVREHEILRVDENDTLVYALRGGPKLFYEKYRDFFLEIMQRE